MRRIELELLMTFDEGVAIVVQKLLVRDPSLTDAERQRLLEQSLRKADRNEQIEHELHLLAQERAEIHGKVHYDL